MSKVNKYTLCSIVLLCVVVIAFLFITNSSPFKKAKSSCELFRQFRNYIIAGNWPDAQSMLFSVEGNNEQSYPDSDYFYIKNRPVIENGKLISLGRDITAEITRAEPRFWVTYDYYRSNKSSQGKVIIPNGYILFKNDKIIFIKFS